MHGKGVWTNGDGRRFEGEFANGYPRDGDQTEADGKRFRLEYDGKTSLLDGWGTAKREVGPPAFCSPAALAAKAAPPMALASPSQPFHCGRLSPVRTMFAHLIRLSPPLLFAAAHRQQVFRDDAGTPAWGEVGAGDVWELGASVRACV
jgi:hypothetical protein